MAKQNKPEGALAPTTPQGGTGMAVYDYGEMAGKGKENLSSADFQIPFLQVLQGLSPQVSKQDPKYTPGAEPGKLFDSVSRRMWEGEKGVVIVPVTTAHTYMEYVPRTKGGGFRGVHEITSPYVAEAKKKSGHSFGKIEVAPKGPNEPPTELIETFSIFAILLEHEDDQEPSAWYVIPFSSTKIKKYKSFMTQLRSVKGSDKIPLFANRVRLVVVPDKNNKGSFYNIELKPAKGSIADSMIPPMGADGKPSRILEAGFKYLKQIESGAAKVAYDSVEGDGSSEVEREAEGPF